MERTNNKMPGRSSPVVTWLSRTAESVCYFCLGQQYIAYAVLLVESGNVFAPSVHLRNFNQLKRTLCSLRANRQFIMTQLKRRRVEARTPISADACRRILLHVFPAAENLRRPGSLGLGEWIQITDPTITVDIGLFPFRPSLLQLLYYRISQLLFGYPLARTWCRIVIADANANPVAFRLNPRGVMRYVSIVAMAMCWALPIVIVVNPTGKILVALLGLLAIHSVLCALDILTNARFCKTVRRRSSLRESVNEVRS
jgi:hypothetical protein